VVGFGFPSPNRRQQIFRRGVVAEGLTHVDEEIFVSRRKHKAAAELQRIFAQAMLFVAGSLSASAGLHVVAAQQVEQGSVAQADSFVGLPLFVDQKRELDAGLLAEEPGVAEVAQADGGKTSAFFLECRFEFAQLRDMLGAKDSTIMAKENQHRGRGFPQRSQTRCFAVGIGQGDSSQFAAERFRHAGTFSRQAKEAVKLPGELAPIQGWDKQDFKSHAP
jgi:hypothetical protein